MTLRVSFSPNFSVKLLMQYIYKKQKETTKKPWNTNSHVYNSFLQFEQNKSIYKYRKIKTYFRRNIIIFDQKNNLTIPKLLKKKKKNDCNSSMFTKRYVKVKL